MEEKVLGSMDGRESSSGKKGKVPGLRNRSRKPGSLPVWAGEEVAEQEQGRGGPARTRNDLHSCDHEGEVSREQTQWEFDSVQRHESESKLDLERGPSHYVNGLSRGEPQKSR